MPPTKIQTSVGLETPQETLDRSKTLLATSQTPFKVDVPTAIQSPTINTNITKDDVFEQRNQLQADQQFDTDLTALDTRIGSTDTPLGGSDEFINTLLLNQPTATQTALDVQRIGQTEQTRGFAGELDVTGQEARREFALPELESNFAETNERIAARTVKLREDIRNFEVNAEQRGVSRQFVQGAKQKIQADAATELADLSIIAAAQQGNLQLAQDSVDRVINEKLRTFEFENAAIEQEIARLESTNTREDKVRSEQLQIALNERQRREDQVISDEKDKLNFLSEAAANGADTGTLDAIRQATTVGEAALLAGPFIGRLDRAKTAASIRASNAGAALNEQKLLDIQAKQAQLDAAVASGELILSDDQADRAAKISKEFEGEAGEFKKVVASYNRILSAAEDASAAGDVAVVFNFMKMLDPGSVVRESEFALAASTGSLKEAMQNKFGRVVTGEILEFTRDDFVNTATNQYAVALDQQIELEERFRTQAVDLFGLPIEAADLIVQDIRAVGAVSDATFDVQLNKASPDQLLILQQQGLLPDSTPNQI